MNLNFTNLPYGSLPYDNIQLCKQMMLRLYEKVPFLPSLPLLDPNDDILHRTFQNMPVVQIKEGKILLPEEEDDDVFLMSMRLDKILKSDKLEDFENYKTDSPYMNLYLEMLRKLKPKYTVINLLGAFSFANLVFGRNPVLLLTDKIFRKFIVQVIAIKALWFIYKIKEYSPETKPIIIFEENWLYKFGSLKRNDELLTKDDVVTLMSTLFKRIKEAGGIVCVHSSEKCNWQLVFETELVDMISLDAYANPNNLNIIAPSVQKFLAGGGYINWGIVPISNENVVRSITLNSVYERFIKTLDELSFEGVSSDLLYSRATVSLQGDISKLPTLFAEKALMICSQLGKKLKKSEL